MDTYLVAALTATGIYVLLTLGLMLQFGFAGLINFGHVAFFAIGAYVSAILSLHGVPVLVSMAAAVILAAVAALPVGLLAIRLREDYLAIAMLAFAETVRISLAAEQWLTGGINGLTGIPRPFFSPGIGRADNLTYLAFVLLMDVAAVLLIFHIVRSPFGRLVRAIRDDENAVQALGKDPVRFKVVVFVLGSALGGLAGALQAHYVTFISPDQFTASVTFYVWIAMILGGAERISGAVVGALLLVMFLEATRFISDVVPWISPSDMASVRLAAVGFALIVCTVYFPHGVVVKVARR